MDWAIVGDRARAQVRFIGLFVFDLEKHRNTEASIDMDDNQLKAEVCVVCRQCAKNRHRGREDGRDQDHQPALDWSIGRLIDRSITHRLPVFWPSTKGTAPK
jgi:hypothetical protein